jgi:hypothetical protein
MLKIVRNLDHPLKSGLLQQPARACPQLKPNDSSREVDCDEEISGGFVVACGDGAVLFEFAEEILDEVARPVGVLVEVALNLAVALGRDHDRLSPRQQRVDHPFVGVEGFVCQQGLGRHVRQQRVGAFQIVGLARGQEEVHRIAQRIDKRMYLGAQPAFAAPNRLVFAVFFCAPALC